MAEQPLEEMNSVPVSTDSPLRERQLWLGMVISLAFLVLFFYRVDLLGMTRAVVEANYLYTLPAVAIYFIGVWFRTLRWHYLLRPVKNIGASELFSAVAIGYMANNILPARAGEFVRAYVVGRKENVSKMSVLATIAVERMFDGLSLLFFMILAWLLTPLDSWLQHILRVGAAFFVGFLAIFLAIATSPELGRRVASLILRPMPVALRGRGQEMSDLFIDGLAALRSPRSLAMVFATSVLAWLAEAAMYYLISLSFAIDQPFAVLVVMTAVANLGTTLPSGPGGMGSFDALSRWTLTLFGVHVDQAAAYTVVLHVVLWLPITLLGLYYLWRENLSLRDARS